MKWDVITLFSSSRHIGQVEAGSQEEARQLAEALPNGIAAPEYLTEILVQAAGERKP